MRVSTFSLIVVSYVSISAISLTPCSANTVEQPIDSEVTQGALRARQADGRIIECPLKHTDVKAEISGFIARVKVEQTFQNPFRDKIEAVYVFPLPHYAAVDDMTMVIGERRVVGVIKRRDEARSIYEAALARGQTAALLEQERPNIFTQSVGNIAPGEEVKIEISYVDPLKYDQGVYEFHFPMVVGPRYIPGTPTATKSGGGFAPNTDRVPDASRITPPPLKPTERTGHDISLQVTLDAGVPVQDLKVMAHRAEVGRPAPSRATVQLSPVDKIPNKDFVLRYAVVGERPEMALLAHAAQPGDGYFMLMIQPKLDDKLKQAPPREVTFLIDVSGSMSGQPTQKVQDAMRRFFERAKPEDRIQVVTFASNATRLFPQPVPATDENVRRALGFTNATRGSGGTEMLKGIREVLADPIDPERVRIVVMLTDGYIGNEAEIIDEVGRRCGDHIRFWTIGIGSSPNRFLIDGVAKQGGGMSAVLGLNEDPTELVADVVERIHRAQLANIRIDWANLGVFATYPAKIPDLWAGRPVVVFGRCEGSGRRTIRINGTIEGKPISYPLAVEFPVSEPRHEVLTTMWARQKIEELSSQMVGGEVPQLVEEITQVSLRHRIMSQYTSFVAVDEASARDLVESPRPPRRVMVPVPLPEGVRWEGIFGPLGEGDDDEFAERVPSRGDAKKQARKTEPDAESSKLLLQYNVVTGLRMQQEHSSRTPAGGSSSRLLARRVAPSSSTGGMGGMGMGAGGMSGGMDGRMRGGMMAGMGGKPAASSPSEMSGSMGGGYFNFVDFGGTIAGNDESFDEGLFGGSAGKKHVGYSQAFASKLLADTAAVRHQEARTALAEADDLLKKKQTVEARYRFQLAFLLEQAALASQPGTNDGTLAQAAARLIEIDELVAQNYADQIPELHQRLNLVIQRRSLTDAVAEIARASGVAIDVLPGSGEDSLKLAGQYATDSEVGPRVVFLDLRGASVAQALTWLLEPMHLTWTIDEFGRVTVASSRRLTGITPWTYDVANYVFPTESELKKEPNASLDQAKVRMRELLAAARLVIGQENHTGLTADSAVMITPGLLMVFGSADSHRRVAALLDSLNGSNADAVDFHDLAGFRPNPNQRRNLAALRETARRRAAVVSGQRTRIQLEQDRLRRMIAVRANSWKLLADAWNGQLNAETVAWLEELWSSPERWLTKQNSPSLDGPASLVSQHSLWAITEAARALPDFIQLRALTERAMRTTIPTVNALEKQLSKKPDDGMHNAAALYTLLAVTNARAMSFPYNSLPDTASISEMLRRSQTPAWRRTATVLLDEKNAESRAFASVRRLAGRAPDTANSPAEQLLVDSRDLVRDDSILLYMLAARQVGGRTWTEAREHLTELSSLVADGNSLLVINRLASRGPSLARNK